MICPNCKSLHTRYYGCEYHEINDEVIHKYMCTLCKTEFKTKLNCKEISQ